MPNKATKRVETKEADFYPDDNKTMFNNPYFRAILNLVTVLVLGKSFSTITNGYFASVTIAVITLLCETLSYSPKEKIRIVLRRIEVALLVVSLIIGALGILSILKIETFNNKPHIMVVDFAVFNGFHIPALVLYIMMIVSYLIAVIDVFAMRTKADEKINGLKTTMTTR